MSRTIKTTLGALAAAPLLLAAGNAHAGLIDFGAAADYNVFTFGDYNVTGSDVEGRLAVGGNADIIMHSVNLFNSGGMTGVNHAGPQPVAVIGGDLNFQGGRIAGNAEIGGTLTQGAANFDGTATDGLGAGISVDFAAAQTQLNNLSGTLNGLTNNGSTNLAFTTLTFTGDAAADVHVFDVSNTDFEAATSHAFVGVDASDAVVINISGTDIDIMGGNYVSGFEDFSSRLIFNFFEATDFAFATSLEGSVLAPFADFDCHGGEIRGQIIVNNWNCGVNGNTQANFNPLTPFSVDMPIPGTLALAALGIVGVAGARKRMQS